MRSGRDSGGNATGRDPERSRPVKIPATTAGCSDPRYSTVTDFARFRGWSTFVPRFTAM